MWYSAVWHHKKNKIDKMSIDERKTSLKHYTALLKNNVCGTKPTMVCWVQKQQQI